MNEKINDPIEKALQEGLDKDLGSSRLKLAMPKATIPDFPSVAQHLLAVAETIKEIHRDLDALQSEFERRLNDLRNRLGSKG